MNIDYRPNLLPPHERDFEIVERKGIDYSLQCLKNFGAVLHHNVDKISIIGV
jgi:S-adenosylmethionine synthetase